MSIEKQYRKFYIITTATINDNIIGIIIIAIVISDESEEKKSLRTLGEKFVKATLRDAQGLLEGDDESLAVAREACQSLVSAF